MNLCTTCANMCFLTHQQSMAVSCRAIMVCMRQWWCVSLTVAWLHILKMEETVVLGCKRRYPLHSSQLIATLPSLSILYIHVHMGKEYKVVLLENFTSIKHTCMWICECWSIRKNKTYTGTCTYDITILARTQNRHKVSNVLLIWLIRAKGLNILVIRYWRQGTRWTIENAYTCSETFNRRHNYTASDKAVQWNTFNTSIYTKNRDFLPHSSIR